MKKQQQNNQKTRKKKKSARSRKNHFGNFLMVLQAVISVILLLSLNWLGMLPLKYIALAGMILLCLWLLYVLSQVNRRKRGNIGKVYSVLLTIGLAVAAFYIAKTNNLVGQISGNAYKTEKVVVAVLASDSAEILEDIEDYDIGVQFDKGAETMESALTTIEEELGKDIHTIQYNNLEEQAEALGNGDVQAIVYSNVYSSVVESALAEYGETPKVVYSTQAKVKLNIGKGKDDSLVKEPFTMYISGLDIYEDTEDEGQRSDVNIIAVVNPKTHQILLVTTPRDYYIPIPGVSEGLPDKLTHAGSYGVDTSMATLGELYETDINYYAQLNFTALIEIVDILGGLDVESEYAFTTHPDSGIVFDVKEGMNHFNGVEALGFARERQNVPGGDMQRGKDQQAVITAMIKKMLSPNMLLKANKIFDTVSRNIQTNVSQDQINALIRYQLNKNPKWSILSIAAEGEPGVGPCYSAGGEELSVVFPDEESIQYIIEQTNIVEYGNEKLEGAQTIN